MHVCSRTRFQLAELGFTWDEAKCRANERKHGVSFEEAATTWVDPRAIELFDEEHSGSEHRWFRIGTSLNGRVLVVGYGGEGVEASTASPGCEADLLRIFGARRANGRERRLHEGTDR
jgi:hypothetical protein